MMRNGVDLDRVNALKSAMHKEAGAGRRTLSGITSWNGGAHSTTIVRNFVVPADEPAAVGGTNRGPSPTELVLTALSACVAISIAYSAAEDGIEVDLIEIDVEGDLDLAGFLEVRRAEGCDVPENDWSQDRSLRRPEVFEERSRSTEGAGPEHEKPSGFEPRRAEGAEFEHRRCDSRQDARPGLEKIRLTVRVDAEAPREKIRELVDHGYRRSPVAAALAERTPIRVCIGWEETRSG